MSKKTAPGRWAISYWAWAFPDPGISQVAADAQATHVVGFIPVIVDLTPYIHADGMTDNVIAIDVSRGDPWFETPGFSGAFRFGQAMVFEGPHGNETLQENASLAEIEKAIEKVE